MRKTLALIFCLTGWFAIIAQYSLMLESNTVSFMESNLRFFSYFTILTNLMVAVYFTTQVLKKSSVRNGNSGILTAITLYIVIVGLIYQVVLRSAWNPAGLQKIVDELLHSVIPVLVVLYWYLYENKSALNYKQIPKWSIYPLLYLFYILARGYFSDFYPYPFVNVSELGLANVLMNSTGILLFFIGLSMLLIRLGKSMER